VKCVIGRKGGVILPDNNNKQDLRIIKTRKAITDAMSKLLETQNFKHITVSDLCEEALVSRATFYVHFEDKYALLQYWLTELKLKVIIKDNTYEQLEASVNNLVQNNKNVIKNLVYEANSEVLDVLHEYIISFLNISSKKNNQGVVSPKHVVLSSFFAGGMVNYILWQVKNKFPADTTPMNIYLFEIIERLRELD